MFRFLPIIILTLLLSCSSSKEKKENTSSEKLSIAAVNYPLYYFAKTIGGDHVTVYLPALDGDPAYWKPDAKQVNKFQNADLILANGAGYAKWMEKVSLPSSKIIITSEGFKDQWMETTEGVAHSHGPDGEHVHKGTAFTTWLNFDFASQQAKVVYLELVKMLPGNEEELKKNFELLEGALKALDSKMKNLGSALGDRQIIASHPVYQYLQTAYGLEIISLHWEPEEMPGVEEWDNLHHIVADHKAGMMIWEGEPSAEIKVKLNAHDLPYSVFNPCANKPESGDFMDVMKKNVEGVVTLVN